MLTVDIYVILDITGIFDSHFGVIRNNMFLPLAALGMVVVRVSFGKT